MLVAGQEQRHRRRPSKGPRARTFKAMLDGTMQLMQSGVMPSVSDVAEAAQVSRATAYRYFPSQAALVQAAVDEALGPVFAWTCDGADVEERVGNLFRFAYPQIQAQEATHRAALLMALDQWTRRQAGTLGDEERVVRGNRRGLLEMAVAPAKPALGPAAARRLAQALSLLFGIESIIVLKDIWNLDEEGAAAIAGWAATALVRAAFAEQADASPVEPTEPGTPRRPRRTKAKSRPG